MFCNNCGTKLDDGQKFCPTCGATQGDAVQPLQMLQQQEPEKKKHGKAVLLVLVILIIIGLVVCGAIFAVNRFSPEARTARLIEEAQDHYGSKDYDEAIDAYRAALEIIPDSVEAYKGLVKIYKKLDDTDELLDVLEEAYKATKDKYFKNELEDLEEELEEAELADATDDSDPDSDPYPIAPYTAVYPPDDLTLEEVSDISIMMWSPITENDSYRHALECAIDDMEEKYPNVIFNWEVFDRDSYKIKIKAAVAAGELPDIFYTSTGAVFSNFVDAGAVYCLDDVYEEHRDELPEVMLDSSTFYGHHYGVPMNMNVVLLYANMDLLEKVGYDEIPDNYNDLIMCCEALKNDGITPFGIAARETWCVSEYVDTFLLQDVGEDTLYDLFLGKETWENDGVAQAVNILMNMISAGYFDPDALNKTYDEVLTDFGNGECAFFVNGSWNCSQFAMACDFEVGMSSFPVLDSRYADPDCFIGGPTEVLAVAEDTAYPVATAQYCFELGKLVCHYGYLDWCGLPTWEVYGDASGVNVLTQEAADMVMNAGGLVPYSDTAMSEDDLYIYIDYLALVYECEIDGQEFSEGLALDIR